MLNKNHFFEKSQIFRKRWKIVKFVLKTKKNCEKNTTYRSITLKDFQTEKSQWTTEHWTGNEMIPFIYVRYLILQFGKFSFFLLLVSTINFTFHVVYVTWKYWGVLSVFFFYHNHHHQLPPSSMSSHDSIITLPQNIRRHRKNCGRNERKTKVKKNGKIWQLLLWRK